MSGGLTYPPDLTLTGGRFRGLESCDAESGGEYDFVCTRVEGHTGRHAAGTGSRIVEVWP